MTPTVGPHCIHSIASIVEPLDFLAMFGNNRPIELELGSGDGSFIIEWAGRSPQRNFVAVERLLGRLRKIDRKARRTGLTNLRALRIEASYVMEYLIPPNSLSVLHVYFPDPWPKRRHWPRRLINSRFVELTHRALQPAGVVYLRTDSAAYFEQMQTVFRGSSSFQEADAPAELTAALTDFERDFLAKGIQTRRAAYQKRIS